MISLRPQYISNKNYNYRSVSVIRSGIHEPTEVVVSFVDSASNGIVAISNLAVPNAFTQYAKYSEVYDICACMDGSWVRYGDKYLFITDNEPTIAVSNASGLHIISKTNTTTLPISPKSVSILRGWKSVIDNEDMGLVVAAYIEETNNIHIYKVIDDMYSLVEYIDIDYTVNSLSTQLLSDYRVMLHVNHEIGTESYISDRLYIGGAVQPEEYYLSVDTTTTMSCNIKGVDITSVESNDSSALISLSTSSQASYTLISLLQPFNITAYNINEGTIHVLLNTDVYTNSDIAISVYASNGYIIPLKNAHIKDKELVLEVFDMAAYMWPITVHYGGGSLMLYNDKAVEPFEVTFVPTGIEQVIEEPPELVSITNIGGNNV